MTETILHNKSARIAPYAMMELARLYGVSIKTLRRWLLPHNKIIGQRVGRFYTAKQVRVIFECLGEPG